MNPSLSRVEEICARFSQQHVLVIGDVMLDHTISGDARRISPEAPVPIVNVQDETFLPGGAGNVAVNLATLGARTDVFSVVGPDDTANLLQSSLSRANVASTGLVSEPNRITTRKTRVLAQRHQMIRLDRESTHPLHSETEAALLAAVDAKLSSATAIIFADYAKGAVTQNLFDSIVIKARQRGIIVGADPKPCRPIHFLSSSVLTPNRKELFEMAGLADPGAAGCPIRDEPLLAATTRVMSHHTPAVLLVTLSEQGLLLLEQDRPPQHLPTFAHQVFDVTGAGDTVIAAYTLAAAAGATPFESATLANHAAGIVVGKPGTAAPSREEILNGFRGAFETRPS